MPRATTEELLAVTLGRRAAPELADIPTDGWSEIADAARRHALEPLLWHRLQARGLAASLDRVVRRSLMTAYGAAMLRVEARRGQLTEVLEALRVRGIPVAPLKGALLAELAYPEPALRPMSDMDLLVSRDRLAEAWTTLLGLGYRQDERGRGPTLPEGHRHGAPLRRRGRLPVELHHTIETCSPFGQTSRELWERARPVRLADSEALLLAPEDLLLHIATHMGHSHLLGASLVSAYDVVAWLERWGTVVDWDTVTARARTIGVRRFVYAALAVARQAFGATLPADVLDALREPADDEVVANAARLLVTPAMVLLGAKIITDPRDSGWSRVQRVARALLLSPARGPVHDDPAHGGRASVVDRYRSRWRVAVRLLLQRRERRDAVRRVRMLRAWGIAGGGH